MKIPFASLTLLFLLPFFSCMAQKSTIHDLKQFSNHGEVFFKFKVSNREELQSLPSWLSVDFIDKDGLIYAYAKENLLEQWLTKESITGFESLQHPGTLHIPSIKSEVDISSIDDWDFYPTYEAYVEMMFQFEQEFPELCRVFSIGESMEGREILMAVISDNVVDDEQESQFLYTSSMHGDETTGYVLFLRLIHHLLNNYDQDEQVTQLVDNLEIWINPLANPDGAYAGGNSSVYGATRGNANGIDLNRNFPDPEDGDHPDGNEWQVETIHFMNLAEENNFVMSSNCHGGFEVCNYPWDTWPQLHADDNWWQFVCREYADTAQFYSPPGYLTSLDNGITNGYQWYSTSGNRQDYMNYFHHCREFILEISNVKLLPENQLQDHWEYNYRSLLNYMNQALFGISGTIVDAENGDPLKASIVIENHDVDESWIVSNEDGWFTRPILEGVYDVTFFKPGYSIETIENIEVNNYNATVLDVQLNPTESGVHKDFWQSNFSIGNNPGPGNFTLQYHGNDPMDISVKIFDQQGRIIFSDKRKIGLNDGVYEFDIVNYMDGIYFLSLRSGEYSTSYKLIKN